MRTILNGYTAIKVGTTIHDIKVVKTSAELEALQRMVEGYIEPCYIPELTDMGVVMLANEEGLLKGLRYNENLYPFFYVGPLVMIGMGEEDFESLTQDQIDRVLDWLEGLAND